MSTNNNRVSLLKYKKQSKKQSKQPSKKQSKKQLRKNASNDNAREKCAYKNKTGLKITGDLHFCTEGVGPCRKLKKRKKNTIVKCVKKSKKNIKFKNLCKQSYTDCSNYGSKTPITMRDIVPKSHVLVENPNMFGVKEQKILSTF